MLLKRFISVVFLSLFVFYSDAFSQLVVVKGRVLDKVSGLPMAGVTVRGRIRQTFSDRKGEFTIEEDWAGLQKSGFVFSSVGYVTQHSEYVKDKFYKVELVPVEGKLNEVVVTAGADGLMRKAISRIPENYPDQAFMMEGVMRIYHLNTDEKISDRFYRGDAVLKIYHPSYKSNIAPAQVSVVQNRFTLYKAEGERTSNVGWINGYSVAGRDLIFQRPAFVSKGGVANYKYSFGEKTFLNNHRVFQVKFSSKGRDGYEGVLYIDSASLAFVAARYTRVLPGSFLPTSIVKSDRYFEYEKLGEKWYPAKINADTKYKNEKYNFIIDYFNTSIDTKEVKPLADKDIVAYYSEDIKQDKPGTDSSWQAYDTLFRKAGFDGDKVAKKVPAEGLVKADPEILKKHGFFQGVLRYLREDNLRYTLNVSRLPLYVSGFQPVLDKNIAPLASWSIGLGMRFRLYKDLFGEVGDVTNYGLGGLKNHRSDCSLIYDFKLNKLGHQVHISPFAGYSTTDLSVKKEKYFKQENLDFGLNVSYQLVRSVYYYVSGTFNHQLSESNRGLELSTQQVYPSTGLIFKL